MVKFHGYYHNTAQIIDASQELLGYTHIPVPSVVYVSPLHGSDDTGDGSLSFPYKTLLHSITTRGYSAVFVLMDDCDEDITIDTGQSLIVSTIGARDLTIGGIALSDDCFFISDGISLGYIYAGDIEETDSASVSMNRGMVGLINFDTVTKSGARFYFRETWLDTSSIVAVEQAADSIGGSVWNSDENKQKFYNRLTIPFMSIMDKGSSEQQIGNMHSYFCDGILVNDPPVGIPTGALYVVGTVPTGDWIGHAKQFAYWNGDSWEFFQPYNGCLAMESSFSSADFWCFRVTGMSASNWEKFETTLGFSYDATCDITFVTNNGNDSTGDGTYYRPYKTVQKAIDVGAQTIIVDETVGSQVIAVPDGRIVGISSFSPAKAEYVMITGTVGAGSILKLDNVCAINIELGSGAKLVMEECWLMYDGMSFPITFPTDTYTQVIQLFNVDFACDEAVLAAFEAELVAHGATMTGTFLDHTGSTTGTRVFSSFMDMRSKKIVKLATPTDATDAANKGYVDGKVLPTVMQNSEEAEDLTTATSPQQAVRFTRTLETAKYKVEWQMELQGAGTGTTSCRGEFEINDVVRGYADQPQANYCTRSGFFFLSATAGSYNFDFNFYRSGGSSGTVGCRSKRLIITKVVE